jgi:outer membrane protein insertion porin family
MKPTKVAFAFFPLAAFIGTVQSQITTVPEPTPQPISTTRKSPVFIEGKTVISEIEFQGLDPDPNYGVYLEGSLYESDAVKLLREERALVAEGDRFAAERAGSVIKILKEWLSDEGYLKADVVAYGTRLGKDGMRLTFSIDRKYPLDPPELVFVGGENISNQEFVDNFKDCSGDGWKRNEFRSIEYYSHACSQKLLYHRGYFTGKIDNIDRKVVDNHYILTFHVHEGPRYRFGEIKIEGTRKFSKREISELLDLHPGDIADGTKLQDGVYEKLKDAYAERGYVQYNAEFDPEFIEPKDEGADGVVNVGITIDEGPQFSIRRIEFTGVNETEAETLKRNFELGKGDLFVPSKLAKAIEEINKTGEFRQLNKDRDIEIRTDEETPVVDLMIKLTRLPK